MMEAADSELVSPLMVNERSPRKVSCLIQGKSRNTGQNRKNIGRTKGRKARGVVTKTPSKFGTNPAFDLGLRDLV